MKAFSKAFDNHQVLLMGGCLALGVIQSNPPVPKFYTVATKAHSLRLPEPDYPTQFHKDPHPAQKHTP